jgi:hypothetical protein
MKKYWVWISRMNNKNSNRWIAGCYLNGELEEDTVILTCRGTFEKNSVPVDAMVGKSYREIVGKLKSIVPSLKYVDKRVNIFGSEEHRFVQK